MAIDGNHVNTMLGTLNTSGTDIEQVQSDPSTHAIMIADGSGGSDNGNGSRNENHVPTLLATSNADGETPVAIYVDSSGNLLTQST